MHESVKGSDAKALQTTTNNKTTKAAQHTNLVSASAIYDGTIMPSCLFSQDEIAKQRDENRRQV